MKVLRSIAIALAIGAASVSTAQAHDSFSFGINIGAPVYAYPAVTYRAAPRVVYYEEPRVIYPASYAYYGAPVVVHRDVYYGGPRPYFEGHRHYRGHRGHYGRDDD